MKRERTDEIISFARDIRKNWGDNPFDIAEKLGIRVNMVAASQTDAYIIRAEKYPTIINIKNEFSSEGKTVLCAHELGHALLHDDGINRFAGSFEALSLEREYEANLFAVALLFEDEEFNTPIEAMSNYTLKTILDYNIKRA